MRIRHLRGCCSPQGVNKKFKGVSRKIKFALHAIPLFQHRYPSLEIFIKNYFYKLTKLEMCMFPNSILILQGRGGIDVRSRSKISNSVCNKQSFSFHIKSFSNHRKLKFLTKKKMILRWNNYFRRESNFSSFPKHTGGRSASDYKTSTAI